MPYRIVDLFAGIGGMRLGFESLGCKTVFSSEIDKACQDMYEGYFGERPHGDIRTIEASEIPDHDILLAGFPCQPFSIIGDMRGFADTRGTLFYEIARILDAKRPKAFLLENVKMLARHQGGRTLNTIIKTLESLNYFVSWTILNALDFGIPQKRERVFIVGFLENYDFEFPSDNGRNGDCLELSDILEIDVADEHYASEHILRKRKRAHTSEHEISIWHENKSGNVSSHPFSCALRAGASYNYLLVNGERRLTSRECLRLMGFPETYKIVVSHSQVRKQAGNAVVVPVVRAVAERMVDCLGGFTRLKPQLALSLSTDE